MSQLRVIVIGETSSAGKQWLEQMQERAILEVHAATDQASIFEDFEKVGDVPVILLENLEGSQSEILALRRSGFPHYIIWFGGTFSKEDYAFALEHRIYAVFEKPEIHDKRSLNLFQRLQLNSSRSSHFNSLVKGLKSLLVQFHSSEESHPLAGELKSAITKLEDLEGQNEFSIPVGGNLKKIEDPLLPNTEEDLGHVIELMEDLERTGALWVRGKGTGEEGRILFLQGKIVFAEAGETTGLKAIYRMFLWETPKFLFAREMASEIPFANENIQYPMDLISQGRRIRMAFENIKEELPPSSIVLEFNAESALNNIELNGRDFNVLSSVIEFGRVSEIVDYNPRPDSEIFQSLIELRKLNLIRVASLG